ncbi:hypothetical protein BMS3Bbin04_00089 [bacterium BMS3Bbin04]|nr:hypothetical protein BMS3Bbin04_00089 [bacterium BMS3Bbin04]
MNVRVEVQYFEGCPHEIAMRQNVTEAIASLPTNVDNAETLVNTDAETIQAKFRGSPTLLINGDDFLGSPAPEMPAMACRYYPNGIPTVQEILSHLVGRI